MPIPAAPTVPVPTSPTFASDAYAFTLWQAGLGPAIDAETARLNAVGYGSYNASSTTSLTIGTGSKSLTIETGKGYAVGQPVMIAETANPTNFMVGQVTSYNSGTGALVANVTDTGGSGTAAAWTLSVTSILSASVPYVNKYETRYYTESSATFTVPDGVTSIRAYAIGGGGNGGGATTGNAGAGGGGGMAYGDIAVAPGAAVTLTIASKIATVSYGGTDMLTANPGTNGSASTAGVGGTSSKHVSVTNGGAFTGGNGGPNTGAGGSAASPLGNGVNGNSSGAGGSGIGGVGGYGGGGAGGDGGAGGAGGTSHGGGSGSAATAAGGGKSRAFSQRFTDPLLRHMDGTGGCNAVAAGVGNSPPGPGGGGAGGNASYLPQDGGDGGGGGGFYNIALTTAANGGFLGGGGGAFSSGANGAGGTGGIGGGGGAGRGTSSGWGGSGGGAAIVIYY